IDPSTLNSNNFYTSAGGVLLPANIAPATDGSVAWLFLKQSMPGGTRVRVVVNGDSIRSADGQSVLDADADLLRRRGGLAPRNASKKILKKSIDVAWSVPLAAQLAGSLILCAHDRSAVAGQVAALDPYPAAISCPRRSVLAGIHE